MLVELVLHTVTEHGVTLQDVDITNMKLKVLFFWYKTLCQSVIRFDYLLTPCDTPEGTQLVVSLFSNMNFKE